MNFDSPRDIVILLHGLLNRPFVVAGLAAALQRDGYEVHNWGYRSRDKVIEDHAADLERFVETLGTERKIHFVGFSLGSIIIRYLLARKPPVSVGRFVMIGPPNHGSDVADRLYPHFWFRWLYKDKSIRQLLASNQTFFETCGIPSTEFGILAGASKSFRGRLFRLPDAHDGAVTVESARLEGAKDFLVLPYTHLGLVQASHTAVQTAHFLKHGRFQR